LTVTALTVIFF